MHRVIGKIAMLVRPVASLGCAYTHSSPASLSSVIAGWPLVASMPAGPELQGRQEYNLGGADGWMESV